MAVSTSEAFNEAANAVRIGDYGLAFEIVEQYELDMRDVMSCPNANLNADGESLTKVLAKGNKVRQRLKIPA